MEPSWKSLRVIMFLLSFFFDIFLSLFLSMYMETCIYIYSCFGYGLLLDFIGRKWNWSDCFCLCTLQSSTFFGHTHRRTTTNSQAWHPQSKTHIPLHSHQFLSMRSFTKNQITDTNSQDTKSQIQIQTDQDPQTKSPLFDQRIQNFK